MYFKLEHLLIDTNPDSQIVNEVLAFYGDDLDRDVVLAQLQLFSY